MSAPLTFWGLFVTLLLIVIGYAIWMWLVERRPDGEPEPPSPGEGPEQRPEVGPSGGAGG